MTGAGTSRHDTIIDRLRATVRGAVFMPDAPEFERARTTFYGSHDRHPALVVRPVDADDVAVVVTTVVEAGLDLSVRGGGHGFLGHAVIDDAVVVDMSGMRHLDVDLDTRTARVGPGLTTGEYTHAMGEHGLATSFGDSGTVGIGGIALGGGIGLLSRLTGLTIDSILAAEMVTAAGEVLQVDAEQRPELFWALRGGGGNFGIVTELTLQLHEVSTVVGGDLVLDPTPEAVAGAVKAANDAPDELSAILTVMSPAPPAPFVPPEIHGKQVMLVQLAHVGTGEAAERAVAPFRDLGTPILDTVTTTTYPELFPDDEPETGPEGVAANFFLDDFTVADAEDVLARLDAAPGPVGVLQLRVLGGAVSRPAPDATAYLHRDRAIMATALTMGEFDDPATSARPWVDGVVESLGGTGCYVNFAGDDSLATARAAYGTNWDRLVAVKRRWDPDNRFHHNVNIPPE